MNYCVLAESDVVRAAIAQLLEPFTHHTGVAPGALRWPEESRDQFTEISKQLAGYVGDASGTAARCNTTVVVECANLAELNPVNPGREATIARLILAYPEVRWIFVLMSGTSGLDRSIVAAHSFVALFTHQDETTLFDASGLRDYVRQKAYSDGPGGNGTKPAAAAAAIDEERAFAYFHAYAAYRFGYRAEAVSTWHHMKRLFNSGTDEPHKFELLFEDVNLAFHDEEALKPDLADFEKRGEALKRLAYDGALTDDNSRWRILVTGGGRHARQAVSMLRRHKGAGARLIHKPVGGIFDLWRAASLPRPPLASSPRRVRAAAPTPRRSDHSAPGQLLQVAQVLIGRAQAMRESARTVEGYLTGAVLAIDAVRVLGFQTTTATVEAIALKHEFEVKAEVAFLGVGHNLELKARFAELQHEVSSAFSSVRGRRAAELDALVSVTNRMMLVFRESGQFDEEMCCLARIRGWQGELRFRRAKTLKGLLVALIQGYAEWLLGSLARIMLALVLWFVALSVFGRPRSSGFLEGTGSSLSMKSGARSCSSASRMQTQTVGWSRLGFSLSSVCCGCLPPRRIRVLHLFNRLQKVRK
jgi:hypothetical protein